MVTVGQQAANRRPAKRHITSRLVLAFSAAVLPVCLVPAGPSLGASRLPNAQEPAEGSWSSMPGGPLQARSGEAVVWTGSEPLVWGGQSTSTEADGLPEATFSNAAWYQPSSGTWQAMVAGPLVPREDAAATWAGTEVFIWGGDRPMMSGYHDYSDGAVYLPAPAAWHLLPPAPLVARHGAQAFWTGSDVLVFGGETGNRALLDGASYDPARGSWAKLPPLPHTGAGTPISTTAVWTGSELLAVVTYEHIVQIPCVKPCTYADSISSRVTVGAWAPGWHSWHMLQTAMPKADRYMPTYTAQAVWAGQRVLLLGGSVCMPGMSCPAAFGPGGFAEAFDPSKRSWEPLGPKVGIAGAWPAAWTGQALVVVDPGGYQGRNPPFTTAGSAASFQPAAGTWAPLPRAPIGTLVAASAAWTGRQLLIWGSDGAGRDVGAVLTPPRHPNAGTASAGYLTGTAQPCLGPSGARPPLGYLMTVSVSQRKATAAWQFVAEPFQFRFSLAAGDYTVGAVGDISRDVRVRPGITQHLDLSSACA